MIKFACEVCRKRFLVMSALEDHLKSDSHKAKAAEAWKAAPKQDDARKTDIRRRDA